MDGSKSGTTPEFLAHDVVSYKDNQMRGGVSL